MANGFMIVNEKDWEKATPDQRDWLIFNTLQAMDQRLKKFEGRIVFDKALIVGGGAIGGFICMGVKYLLT
jgi:hypothetical protein